jgi:hypothetical protein
VTTHRLGYHRVQLLGRRDDRGLPQGQLLGRGRQRRPRQPRQRRPPERLQRGPGPGRRVEGHERRHG